MGILNNILKRKEENIIENKKQNNIPYQVDSPKEQLPKQPQVANVIKKMIANEEIRKELDNQQLSAVESPLGNTCVFAIAGAGKTRVLTYRVANLIANGIPEQEMLLLTFTNKAADEMTDRIKKILKKDRLNLLSGTFHSVASSFLREYYAELLYKKNYKIITPGIQKSLIENCRNDYLEKYLPGFNNEEFPSKNIIADIYSGAINHNKTFREYISEYYPYYKNDTPDGIILILKDYVERKNKDNLMDFDDLLLNFLDLLQIPEVKQKINNKYKYIFVDEYQDINWMQYQILELLNNNDTIFVIGDSKQCIYQFRGSRSEYIDIFKKTHKNVFDFSLNMNYRSCPDVLKLAEDVISHNDFSQKVIMRTNNPSTQLPLIFGCDNEIKEIEQIVKFINENQYNFEETAILVRRGAQISIVEQILKKYKLPYNLIGNTSMFESEHVQDIIAFLQLIDDKSNEAAFMKIAKLFSGIGVVGATKMYKTCQMNKFDYVLSSKLLTDRQNYAMMVMAKIIGYKYTDISHMIQYILNSFYDNYSKYKYADYEDRMEDLRYLLVQSKNYNNLNEFLDDIVITKQESRHENKKKCLTVITMHKSKGLEWDNVFIPFINKGEYPRCKDKEFLQNTENIKNERNLFYVAITRAKRNLYLSYSLFYTDKPAGPSPFLEELDEDLYDADFFK